MPVEVKNGIQFIQKKCNNLVYSPRIPDSLLLSDDKLKKVIENRRHKSENIEKIYRVVYENKQREQIEINRGAPLHQVVRRIINRRNVKTSNKTKRTNKKNNFKLSKKRNKSMSTKGKTNGYQLNNTDIEGLNIQTDNFF
mmetsp:Transcript_6653/g.5761  ORF Transcript_6653/g.5761 Transcript_6653/m.5761 type:complete len:140 (-) Transcript_6653:612-1031(-)